MKLEWVLTEGSTLENYYAIAEVEGGKLLRHVFLTGQYATVESMVFIPNIVNNHIKIKEKVKK